MKKRVAKNLLATIVAPGSEFFAFVHDLAPGGLGFTCNRKFNIGSAMAIELNVPGQPTMEMKGVVIWVRTLPPMSKYRYQYGFELVEKPESYDQYVEALLTRANERRKSPRYKAMLEVRNEDVLELLHAATEDVSAEGFYLRTGRPLVQGDEYEISLSVSELDPPVRCHIEVVAVFSCEPDPYLLPHGAGVKIVSFLDDGEKRFEDYINQLKALYQYNYYLQTSSSTFGQAFA